MVSRLHMYSDKIPCRVSVRDRAAVADLNFDVAQLLITRPKLIFSSGCSITSVEEQSVHSVLSKHYVIYFKVYLKATL